MVSAPAVNCIDYDKVVTVLKYKTLYYVLSVYVLMLNSTVCILNLCGILFCTKGLTVRVVLVVLRRQSDTTANQEGKDCPSWVTVSPQQYRRGGRSLEGEAAAYP